MTEIAVINATALIDKIQTIPLPELFLIVLAMYGLIILKLLKIFIVVGKDVYTACKKRKKETRQDGEE